MKKFTEIIVIVAAMAIGLSYTANAQVSISTDGDEPDSSAMLEVRSTSKGFLPPRMTEEERDDIGTPANGLVIFNTTTKCLNFYADGFWYKLTGDPDVKTVYNPATGKTWMDRNLGASRVAVSSNDTNAYGDLYQWGRAMEGHEKRTSGITSVNATTPSPIPNAGNVWDGLFITETQSPYDWLIPQNDTLWQGVNGTNNPCPAGFRLPTDDEWYAEVQSWPSTNAAGAFASPLKLPVAGGRNPLDGTFFNIGISGYYWSSTISDTDAKRMRFDNGNAVIGTDFRAYGISVRCIKE